MYYDPNPKYYEVKKELLTDLIENDCVCLDDVCFNGVQYFSNDLRNKINDWEGQYNSNDFAVAFVIDGHYYVTPKVEEAVEILRSARVRKTIIPVPFSNIDEFPFLLGGKDLYSLCNDCGCYEAAKRVFADFREFRLNNFWDPNDNYLVRLGKKCTECEDNGGDWTEVCDFREHDNLILVYDGKNHWSYRPKEASSPAYRVIKYYRSLIKNNEVFQKWDKLLQESGQLPDGETLANRVEKNIIEYIREGSINVGWYVYCANSLDGEKLDGRKLIRPGDANKLNGTKGAK